MTKRALTILIAAIVAVGLATAVIASSVGGDGDGSPSHAMPGGQTMTGESMTNTTHGMGDGSTMDGEDMDEER